MPGLNNLCRDAWFSFTKERYQYTGKGTNNNKNKTSTLPQQTTANQERMDIEQKCDLDDESLTLDFDHTSYLDDPTLESDVSVDDSNVDHEMDETLNDELFLPTYDESKTEQTESDDDDLCYDDAD